MNVYSKNLGKEVDVEVYSKEADNGMEKTIVTSCSLLNLFNQMKELTRSFPVQIMGKDYCYARCVITMPDGRTYDNDGDCNAEFEDDINKNHIGMTASRRAFDRAFLDLLQLDLKSNGRVYSSSEGIKGKSKSYVPGTSAAEADAKADAEAEGTDESCDSFSIGDEKSITETGGWVDLTDIFKGSADEAEPLPDEILLTVGSKAEEKAPEKEKTSVKEEKAETPVESPITFEQACAHEISFDCAQQGRTIKELYEEGKVKFLQNILKYCDEDMKADVPYVKAFLGGVESAA